MTTLTADHACPIVLRDAEIRAVRDGVMSELRLPVTPQPPEWAGFVNAATMFNSQMRTVPAHLWQWSELEKDPPSRLRRWPEDHHLPCPLGTPGEAIWVRETWVYRSKHDRYYYRADHPKFAPYAHNGWKRAAVMPRKACRFLLEILTIRIERLQQITEEGALASGIRYQTTDGYKNRWHGPDAEFSLKLSRTNARDAFAGAWDAAYRKLELGWMTNPWTWVIGFKPVPGLYFPL